MSSQLHWVPVNANEDKSRKRERRQAVQRHVMRDFIRRKRESEESRRKEQSQRLTIQSHSDKDVVQCLTPPESSQSSSSSSDRSVSPPVQRVISAALDPFDTLPVQSDPFIRDTTSFRRFPNLAAAWRITNTHKVVYSMPPLLPDSYVSSNRKYAAPVPGTTPHKNNSDSLFKPKDTVFEIGLEDPDCMMSVLMATSVTRDRLRGHQSSQETLHYTAKTLAVVRKYVTSPNPPVNVMAGLIAATVCTTKPSFVGPPRLMLTSPLFKMMSGQIPQTNMHMMALHRAVEAAGGLEVFEPRQQRIFTWSA
jgi:hypothetical protein